MLLAIRPVLTFAISLRLFPEPVPSVSRRKVRQFAIHLVRTAPVELGRLETEGVQLGVGGAALPGLLLRQGQVAMAITLAAEILTDDQQVDVEPAPVRLADQAARNGLVLCVQRNAYPLSLTAAGVLDVVLADAAPDDLPHGVTGVLEGYDRAPLGQGL